MVTGVAAELTIELSQRPDVMKWGSDMVLTFFGKGRGAVGGTSDTNQIKFPAIQEVRAYWEALRVGSDLPCRDQIDPRGLSKSLEQVFLIEQVAAGHARFRLAGMHLADLMGMDVTGMPLTSLFEPVARTRFSAALATVFDGPSVTEVWLEAERGIGRPPLDGRMLLLPLIGSSGEPNLALGCLATHGVLGRSPRRFAISGLTHMQVDRAKLQSPVEKVTGFADPQADFAPRPPRGKPVLRIVSQND